MGLISNMSKDNKLAQVSYSFSCVFNDNELHLFKNPRYIKQRFCTGDYTCTYIAIMYHEHDRDDDNNLRTPHYHVVLDMLNKFRVETMLNYIVKLFNCNANQISIEKCNDLGAQTRYLIHFDNPEKYRYDVFDICTNNQESVDYYLSYFVIHDERDLIKLCDTFHSRKEIYKRIGNAQYKKYAFIIRDLVY